MHKEKQHRIFVAASLYEALRNKRESVYAKGFVKPSMNAFAVKILSDYVSGESVIARQERSEEDFRKYGESIHLSNEISGIALEVARLRDEVRLLRTRKEVPFVPGGAEVLNDKAPEDRPHLYRGRVRRRSR